MSDELDQAIESWFAMTGVLTTRLPQGILMRQGAAVAMITGLGVPTLNTVVAETVEPDVAAMSDLAAKVGATGLPWSIQVRRDGGAVVEDLARANGLSGRETVPFMICGADEVRLDGRDVPGVPVVRVGAAGRREHGRALDLGFETGGDVLVPLAEATVMDAPGWIAYAAEIDGEQVATALGVRHGAVVGVFNVSVLPRMRNRGLGRVITERVLADGFEAGATLAYLQSTPMAEHLYRSMGFYVAETWTVFS